MIDVRDLEVPPADSAWDTAPEVLRAAVRLLVPVTALALLRVWLVATQWAAFEHVFGRSHQLDMTTEAGWATAALRTPGQGGSVLDVAAVVVVGLLVVAVRRRVREARWFAVFLAAGVVVDALASLAYAVPWWYVVATVMLAGWLLVLVGLLMRPATTMHLLPEPLVLRESWLHGERPVRGGRAPHV